MNLTREAMPAMSPHVDTTTIEAIVVGGEESYTVFFASEYVNDAGCLRQRRGWHYVARFDPTELEAAEAYALIVAQCADPILMRSMDPWQRSPASNWQGCWNAPIVHRVSVRHEGELWRIE